MFSGVTLFARKQPQADYNADSRSSSPNNSLQRIAVMRATIWNTISILLVICATSSCSMNEEMKRIEAAKQMGEARQQSNSTNLTGEQIFYRSCNTCHPSGKKGLGPRLDQVNEHYPENVQLAALIRNGKGTMPPQAKDDLNEDELKNIMAYARTLSESLKESAKK